MRELDHMLGLVESTGIAGCSATNRPPCVTWMQRIQTHWRKKELSTAHCRSSRKLKPSSPYNRHAERSGRGHLVVPAGASVNLASLKVARGGPLNVAAPLPDRYNEVKVSHETVPVIRFPYSNDTAVSKERTITFHLLSSAFFVNSERKSPCCLRPLKRCTTKKVRRSSTTLYLGHCTSGGKASKAQLLIC